MDKFSLKDSGRGDSEAGDSDYEPGRESPMDRLLGEGFTEIYAPDGQHRPHAGTTLPPSHHTSQPLPSLPSMSSSFYSLLVSFNSLFCYKILLQVSGGKRTTNLLCSQLYKKN